MQNAADSVGAPSEPAHEALARSRPKSSLLLGGLSPAVGGSGDLDIAPKRERTDAVITVNAAHPRLDFSTLPRKHTAGSSEKK